MPKHWNCFVAGCGSNFNSSVYGLKYYRIPKKLTRWYDAFFKTDYVNWDTAVICSLHWSSGRNNFKDLPDIRLPGEKKSTIQNSKRKLPYERSAKRRKSSIKSLDLKAKLNEACGEIKDIGKEFSELQRKFNDLRNCNKVLKESNERLQLENNTLHSLVDNLKQEKEEVETTLKQLKEELYNKSFNWTNIDDPKFEYLCGLQKNDFSTLFNCFQPFLHLLRYEGCKTNQCHLRTLSKENELFASLVICRHALHLGIIRIISWFIGVSESSMSRIFEAWMTFGHAVFSKLNLAHPKDLVQQMMPKVYKNLDFSHIVLVIDATEFKISGFTNLELNQLFFSDYKNSHTVKALPCLTPHGSACLIPQLYPGSITDTTLTDMVGALDNMLCHDGVLTDKGFAISELAAMKGAVHNRPPMKSAEQFTTGECDENFKVACLRIHVERW